MARCPLFVELCAGTAAVSLSLHGGRKARPPVSRMGSKRGYASAILGACGLYPGERAERYLWCEPDPGVRLLLEAYRDPELAREAAAIIRSWADEEPRALWERLRAEGPPRGPEPLALAAWSTLQGGAVMAFPIALGEPPAPKVTLDPNRAGGERGGNWPEPVPTRLGERADAAMCATIHDDARKVEPREVARWGVTMAGSLGGVFGAGPTAFERWGHNPKTGERFPGNPALDAAPRIESATGLLATIHDDARTIDPPRLPPGTVAYLDPPYVNTTSYGHDLPRSEVVALARRWADAGALVVISEQEPLPALMADGWHSMRLTSTRRGQKRTFSRQQEEYLTMSAPPVVRPLVQESLFA